jgi:hypothetical protein
MTGIAALTIRRAIGSAKVEFASKKEIAQAENEN